MEEIAIRLQSLWRGTRCRLQFASSNGYTPIHDLCAPNERREVKLCRFKGRLRVVKVYHTRTLKRTKRLLCTVSRSGRKAKIKQSNMLQVLQEIAIMKKLAHPYIVRLHEVIGDESGTALILVLQYVEGGQLMTWNDRQRRYLPNPRSRPVEVKIGRRAMGLGAIATNHHGRRRSTRAQKGLEKRWRLKQAVIQRYVLHVARGLEYLHSCGIVHRDLKPENLLLTSDGQRCLITDFGVATLVQRRGDRIRSSQRIPGYSSKPCPTPKRPEGTAAFFPPECATLDEPSQALDDAGEAGLVNRKTDPAAQDIWGLGVVLYCMICGRLPFWCPGDTIIDMVRRITEDDYVLTEEYPTGAEESDSDQSFRVDNDITSSDEDSSEEDEVWLQSFKTRRDADKSGDSRGGPGIGSSAGAPAHGWVEDGTQGSFPGKFRNREKTQGNGQETDKSDQSTGRRRPTKRSQWRDKVQASEEDTDEEDDRWLQSFKSCRGDSKKDDCEAIRLKPADQARFTNDDRRKLATLDHRILAVKDHDHSSYRGTANGEIRACGGRRTWSGSGINNDRGAGDRSGDAEELEARLATRKAGKAKEFATNGAPADSTFTPTKLTESVRGDSSQRHHGSGTVTSNIGEDVGGADLCAEEGLGRSKVEGDALEVCTECRDLLAQLLQKRPSKRYSARDALVRHAIMCLVFCRETAEIYSTLVHSFSDQLTPRPMDQFPSFLVSHKDSTHDSNHFLFHQRFYAQPHHFS